MESYVDPDGRSCYGCPYDRVSPASANFLRDHKLKSQGFLRYAPGNDIDLLPFRQLYAFGVIDGAIGRYEREQARERERRKP